jgi:hypothetical protein
MHTESFSHWWDWRNWRTWTAAGIAALLVIAATVYMTDTFGWRTPSDAGEVTITEPVVE